MKFSAATLPTEQVSDHGTRQRVTGTGLECIFYTYQAGAVFERHQHEAEQTTIVLSGELVFTFDDEELRLGAGEAVLIAGGKPHGAFVPEDAPETRTHNVFSPVRERLP
ncbi:hypothetical protein BH24DEI2_BH24DEI2_15840 [soil metagenome]